MLPADRNAPESIAPAPEQHNGAHEPELIGRFHALQSRLEHSWPARFVGRFIQDDILALSAALAFYTLLSLAPLVVMLLWLTTALYPAAQDEFFHQVGLLVGPQVESTARLIVSNAERRPKTGSLAALMSVGALLVGASIVFGQLQSALNRVFRSDAKQLGGLMHWLRKRLLSFGMALGVGFLLVVSMAVQAALAILMHWLPDLLPAFAAAVSFLLYAVVFSLIYRLLPDRPVSRGRALFGGALTAGLFMFGRWAIGLYLGQASLGSAYGPAGGLVVMLVWLYYCAIVFMTGALITAMLDTHARVKKRMTEQQTSTASAPEAAAAAGTTGLPVDEQPPLGTDNP